MDELKKSVDEMNVLEMIGIKNYDTAYSYYSSKSKEDIEREIAESLREAGIDRSDPRYDSLFDEYKEGLFKREDLDEIISELQNTSNK